MSEIIFITLLALCIGLVYIVHKYFGKEEFYLLTIIYMIISLITSFKIIKVFGIDINANAIFYLGILTIIYYFVNRYSYAEVKRFLFMIIMFSMVSSIFLILASLYVPSIYDLFGSSYTNLILSNGLLVVLHLGCLVFTSLLSFYCFNLLKIEKEKRLVKVLITNVGLLFIDSFLFSYFGYAFTIHFSIALRISLNNYLIRVIIMVIYFILINKIFGVKKVKE